MNKDKKFEEVIEELASKAKAAEYNNLAIVLYSYMGSEKAGLGSLFAEHCQDFAKSGLDWINTEKRIEQIKNRKNN